jgi:glycosyltransferase involved in cell wall biosynthesis
MKSDPKFSIITVSYNAKDDLEKTIKSVSDQSFKNYEYIIIDGNSTDGTKVVLKKYDREINYWISERDEGIYNAMNKGAKVAKGEYLYFLNAGDTFHNKNVLKDVAEAIDNEDLLYGKIRVVNKENEKSYIRERTLTKFNLKLGNKVSQQAVFIKKSVFEKVDGLNEKYRIASDFDLLCKVFEGNYLIKKIDLTICDYDGGGISSDLKKSYWDTGRIIKDRYGIFTSYFYKLLASAKLFLSIFYN